MFDLTPEEVADAEACGVSFPTATPAQVQRYAMQKKVFRIGGAAVLATRDGALFETAGTLGRIIAEGDRQRRDLAEWEAAPPPAEAPAPPPLLPVAAPPVPLPPSDTAPEPATPPETRTARTAKPRKIPRAERWLTAGAERRGRLARHWSARR